MIVQPLPGMTISSEKPSGTWDVHPSAHMGCRIRSGYPPETWISIGIVKLGYPPDIPLVSPSGIHPRRPSATFTGETHPGHTTAIWVSIWDVGSI